MFRRASYVAVLALLAACNTPSGPARGGWTTTVEGAEMRVTAHADTATVIVRETGASLGNFRLNVLAEIEVGGQTGCATVTTTGNTAEVSNSVITSTLILALAGCPPVPRR